MTYGVAVWGGGNVTNVSRIYKINRAAINIFVGDLPKHIPSPFQYDNVYSYHCSIIFHKFVTTDNLEYFNAKISNLIPVHNHSTRFMLNNKYTLPAYNKSVSQNQFLFSAIKIWNLSPQSVRDVREPVKSKSKFHLREHVFDGN